MSPADLTTYVDALVAAAPRLRPETLDRLAVLLRPSPTAVPR